MFKLHPVNKRGDKLGAVHAQYFSIPLKIFAGVCSLGNVCNMAPWHYEAEGMPPSCLPLAACITPCIRSWPPLHGFWPPSSQRAIASIQESFYPLRGRTRSVVNSKPWITSSKLIGGHLPKTMKLNLSRTEKKIRNFSGSQSPMMKNLEDKSRWTRLNLPLRHLISIVPLRFMHRFFLHRTFLLNLSNLSNEIDANFVIRVDNSFESFSTRKKKKDGCEYEWTSKLHPWPYLGFIFEDREKAVSKMTASQNYAMLTKQAEQHLAVVPITASSCFRKFVSLVLRHHTEWTILSELPEELHCIMYFHFKIRLIKT